MRVRTPFKKGIANVDQVSLWKVVKKVYYAAGISVVLIFLTLAIVGYDRWLMVCLSLASAYCILEIELTGRQNNRQ